MLIKAEVEIESDDEELGRWLVSHGDSATSDDAVSEVEGMEFSEDVAGLRMMLRFHSAKES